jgi:RHS repeat-associated protein
MLGRKISLESKDSGRKEYFYDASGNLIEETDSKLKKNGKSIKYEYDGMNRLVKIDYPDSTDTTYYYGESNAEDNGANRVVKVTDETGMKSVSYGLLGEVVEESRTIGDYNRIKYNEKNKWWKYWWHNIHKDWWGRRHHKWYHRHHWHGRYKHHYPWYGEGSEEYNGPEYEDGAYTSKMSYTSDYLGRMAYITYPDGETISYSYDKGGQVTGVKGYRNEKETVYVSKIGYDEYGQRTYIEYGNGVKTSYTDDENRRWLDTIKTTSATDRILQNMTYNFDKVGNVRGYENIGENYKTAQNYKYDSLYQLVGVKGQTEYKPRWPEDHEDYHKYVSTYEQSFRFDNIGNMKSKYSEKLDKPHNQHTSSDLNYSFEYKYDPEYAHRTLSADNMYYSYDENGNIINERIDREATKEELEHDIAVADEVYSLDYGIALPNQPSVETKAYSRTYVWNERNLLRTSVENGLVVQYRYGEDGQRAVKSSSLGETLYFNNMWQMSTTPMGMRQTKHIFVGETRIATKNNWWQDTGTEYEKYNTYWYHADHLGSAQLVSNWKGEEYERIEYTPYGEIWVEKVKNGHESINYRFTGKEMDSETGLYYFGARYLDPKYSRWLSTDPALRDYIPQAPVNDEARKNNQNLPGQGGLFNHINSNLYHYAGNNPVKYTDPDGEYSRESAVLYSQEWNHDRNPNYAMAKFPWSIKNPWDCANFVSQSLQAGGIKLRSDWFNNPGEFNFLGRRTDKNFSTNWTTANGLINWLRTQNDIYNGESLLRKGEKFESDLMNALEMTKVGDVVGWSNDENGKEIHHVGIVTKIEDGRIYYDAHTKDRNKEQLVKGNELIVIIHIQDGAE